MWGRRNKYEQKQNKLITNHTMTQVSSNLAIKAKEFAAYKKKNLSKLRQTYKKLVSEKRSLSGGYKTKRRLLSIRRELKEINSKIEYFENDRYMCEFLELVQPVIDYEKICTNNNASTKPQQSSSTTSSPYVIPKATTTTHVIPHMNPNQARHLLYLKLFHPDKAVPLFTDRDFCSVCNIELQLIDHENILLCPNCGLSEYIIFCESDFIHNEHVKSNKYEQAPLYRKYLMQWKEDVPDIPEEVMCVVYKKLSKVHIMSNASVKCTPIAQILRQNGFQMYAGMALRIAKIMNGEEIVKLNNETIERLVERFLIITCIDNLYGDRSKGKKIINFEFLTNKFLLMEKKFDLAERFYNHKTRTVLNRADLRLQKCCDIIEASKINDWNWKVHRSS